MLQEDSATEDSAWLLDEAQEDSELFAIGSRLVYGERQRPLKATSDIRLLPRCSSAVRSRRGWGVARAAAMGVMVLLSSGFERGLSPPPGPTTVELGTYS